MPPGERAFLKVSDQINMLVPWYLMASYGYYCRDESLLKDTTFDDMCLRLEVLWDQIEHRHKHLIDFEALSAGTCLIPVEAYPRICVGAACRLLSISAPP